MDKKIIFLVILVFNIALAVALDWDSTEDYDSVSLEDYENVNLK